MTARFPAALAVLLFFGCARSPLMRKEDAAFTGAVGRYRQSLAGLGRPGHAVPRSQGNAQDTASRISPDAALFLQAEAFYLYRPGSVAPGAFAIAAQALAASTDFAPLTAWAASAEIGSLRLQTYDGAAQLYEGLLASYPASPYGPLALYRLGWAYRSVGTRGWPRGSREAFAELQREFPGSEEASLAREALTVPYRTQEKAAAWSILPGAGQIYIGEKGNGAIRFALAAAFAAAAIIPPIFMIRDRDLDWTGAGISVLGFIGLQVSYTLAFQDAQRGAIAFNERAEASFRESHPGAP
jgi:hypothetical protein